MSSSESDMAVLGKVLDEIESNGAHHCRVLASEFWEPVDDSLKSLAKGGTGGVAAQFLCMKVERLFLKSAAMSFRSLVIIDPRLALSKLHGEYVDTVEILKRCLDSLGQSRVLSKFTVGVRSGILNGILTESESNAIVKLREFLLQRAIALIEDLDANAACADDDPTFSWLHKMMWTKVDTIKSVWADAVDIAISNRVDCCAESTGVSASEDLFKWQTTVLDRFCCAVLAGTSNPERFDDRTEVDLWRQHCTVKMLDCLGRKRIAQFFDLVVEYPDSTPGLEDLEACLARPSETNLTDVMVKTAKETLATKLHHPGARTQDILTVLVSTIRSLQVILSRSDQGTVIFAIVNDTLQHLKQRKDSVGVVVKGISQPHQDSVLYGELQSYSSRDDADDAFGRKSMSHFHTDVIRILLSVLSVSAIVSEYKTLLCDQLLAAKTYDTTNEEEVLERLKRIFGEDALAPCIVMIRDIQQSRRLNKLISGDTSLSTMNVKTVSITCWPITSKQQFEVHPALSEVLESYADAFKRQRPAQLLKWVLEHSAVNISVAVGDTTMSHRLDLLSASVALHLGDEGGPLKIADVAAKLKIKDDIIFSHLSQQPAVFHVKEGAKTVELQSNAAVEGPHVDDDSLQPARPDGFTEEQVDFFGNMIGAMLKTQGAKTVQQIENSARMFGGFDGNTQRMKKLLEYFANSGRISTSDGVTYTVPK